MKKVRDLALENLATMEEMKINVTKFSNQVEKVGFSIL